MAAMGGAINVYVTPSEPNRDLTPRIVEIDPNGNETLLENQGLTEEQKKFLFSLLLAVLLAQASCFSSFQALNILLILMQGSASETEQLIAVWSTLILLAIAAGTVLSETTIRFINWIFSEANEEPENRLLFLIDLLKTITVSFFCANFYLEQVKTFNPAVAKTGSDFFVGLILYEVVVSGAISAHIPSKNYLSTAFFIDSFLKAFISVAAILQLNEKTALAGFFMAAILFAFVAMNVILIMINERADMAKAYFQSEPSHSINDENTIPLSIIDSVNNDIHNPELSELTPLQRHDNQCPNGNVILSKSQPAFFGKLGQRIYEGVCERVSNIPRYLQGEGSTPPQLQQPRV